MTTGVIGNCLVLYVYNARLKKDTSSYFILFMATLDLISCCIGMPFELMDLTHPYTFSGRVVCKVFKFILSSTVIASGFTLISVAFDRYYKVCKPIKKIPSRTAKILFILAIVTGLSLSWPGLIFYGYKKFPLGIEGVTGIECSIDDTMIGTIYPVLYYAALGLVLCVSFTVFIVLYVSIGVTLWKRNKAPIGEQRTFTSRMLKTNADSHKRSVSSLNGGDIDHQKKRKKRKISAHSHIKTGRATLIFLTVTSVFVASFTPFVIVMTLKTLQVAFVDFQSDAEEIIYNILVRFYFISNCANPFVYSAFNVKFRKACLNLFRSCCRRCKS